MTTTRKRRIVSWAVIAALVVTLPVWYMASVLTLSIAVCAGWTPPAVETSPIAEAYVHPAAWYLNESGLPGDKACEAVFEWFFEAAGVQ